MGKVCQGLFLRLSENPILTGLAETRNGVFLFREGIRELSAHAETRGTGGFSYCAHTGHTTEKASEERLDFGGLGCCLSVVFHEVHYPHPRGFFKTNPGFFSDFLRS